MKKKDKKNSNEPEMENFLDVFLRNYRNVPGFNALVKIILYFIFIAILVIAANLTSNYEVEEENSVKNETTTAVIERMTYKDIVDSMTLNGTSFKINITVNDNKYLIDGNISDGVITGTFESVNGIKKYSIEKGIIYNNTINGNVENNELFENLNIHFINLFSLNDILLSNNSIKTIDDNIVNYKYNYNDEIDYIINTQIENNSIKAINITSENIEYIINID